MARHCVPMEGLPNNQRGPVGGNANGSVYLHTCSSIQDRPHRSLSIIGAIRILNNAANRRIPRASSTNNSRLLLLVVVVVVVVLLVAVLVLLWLRD
jgi:hypothetical protein